MVKDNKNALYSEINKWRTTIAKILCCFANSHSSAIFKYHSQNLSQLVSLLCTVSMTDPTTTYVIVVASTRSSDVSNTITICNVFLIFIILASITKYKNR